MKILFLGTPEFAAKNLEALTKEQDIEVVAVVSQPDRPVGRKQILAAPAVKVTAEAFGLPVFQPENNQELQEQIKKFNDIDFFIVVAFGMILPQSILEIPKHGAINIHASLLPKYRGASPIQQAILKGDSETGISIMQMDEKLDHGGIYEKLKIKIDPKDTAAELSEKLAKLSSENITSILRKIIRGELSAKEQEHKLRSYCKKISKEDGEIDWHKSATEIINMIRAYTPWPGTYTKFKDKKLKIIAAEKEDGKQEIGTFKLSGSKLQVGTSKGLISPTIVQQEGKKISKISDFINGNRAFLE